MHKISKTPPRARAVVESVYFWLLLGCLLTILLLLGYNYLPEKRHQLVHDKTISYIYADEQNRVEFIDHDALKWHCEIIASHQSAFCGFHIYLGGDDATGTDLSSYSRIELQLQYAGESPYLRYYFRNYEPGFSVLNQMESDKFMQAQIAKSFIDDGLVIGMDEFYVAQWWLAEFEVPRELSGPSFRHITAFGIDLSYPAAPGKHSVQLYSAELVGPWVKKEQWYLAIITSWLLVWVVGAIVWLLRVRQNMARERQKSRAYRELSHRDQLTGLLNRNGITEAIERLFASEHSRLSLLVIDIDHFKPINDQYGHDVGDNVLSEMGQLLRNTVRQSDYAARWGGEEFVILLPETGIEDARILAEKLRRQIYQQRFSALPDIAISVSIGLAQRQSQEAYHQLFRRADTALYMAKARGRNQVVKAEESEA